MSSKSSGIFQGFVMVMLLAVLGVVTIGVLNDVKYMTLMAKRATLPVEVIVPELWTQCQVQTNGWMQCKTLTPEEWTKRSQGTIL